VIWTVQVDEDGLLSLNLFLNEPQILHLFIRLKLLVADWLQFLLLSDASQGKIVNFKTTLKKDIKLVKSDNLVSLEPVSILLQVTLKSYLEYALSFPGKFRVSILCIRCMLESTFVAVIGGFQEVFIVGLFELNIECLKHFVEHSGVDIVII
jgi:hypothetical protein